MLRLRWLLLLCFIMFLVRISCCSRVFLRMRLLLFVYCYSFVLKIFRCCVSGVIVMFGLFSF